jgi:hypothetical protein
MWKKVAQPDRPQMTIQHVCFACCTSKDTDTHSEWDTYCLSTATMITWTHLSVMFICILPLLFKLKFYTFSLCLSVDCAGVTPELSPDKQCSTTLNNIMACNLQTGFKEGFHRRPCCIEPMAPQLKYIQSQKHFDKTSYYDTRGPNLIQLLYCIFYVLTL